MYRSFFFKPTPVLPISRYVQQYQTYASEHIAEDGCGDPVALIILQPSSQRHAKQYQWFLDLCREEIPSHPTYHTYMSGSETLRAKSPSATAVVHMVNSLLYQEPR